MSWIATTAFAKVTLGKDKKRYLISQYRLNHFQTMPFFLLT